MSHLSKIHELNEERQKLWQKSGKQAFNRYGHVGMDRRDQERLHQINKELTELWQARKDCTNPFCDCHADNHYDKYRHPTGSESSTPE